MNKYYFGVVEDRADELRLGRCRVRVLGVHNSDKAELPTADLPWAIPIQPITSAGVSGIGFAPVGPVEGTWVVCVFTENDMQTPMILGTVGGIPGATTHLDDYTETEEEVKVPTEQQYVTTGSGGVLVDSSGTPVTSGEQPAQEEKYLGSLTKAQYERLKAGIAKKESGGFSDPYQALERKNKRYIGKYQIGGAKLEDFGYIKKGYTAQYSTSAVDMPEAWTGKDGIKSKQDLLNAPALQEQLMDRMLSNNAKALGKSFDITRANPAKLGGLLYCSHNIGLGSQKRPGAIQYFTSGGTIQGADGNGFQASASYGVGFEAVAGKKNTADEHPSIENIYDEAAANPVPAAAEDNRKYDTSQAPVVKQREYKRREAASLGFVDPNGKYPKKEFLKEPDTNRLARAVKVDKTIVGTKERDRVKAVPIANSGTTWQQPYVPYNAKYPFNHVFESESGHVMEFDDTPERERVHLYHKSGTFFEIDANGTKVEKVEGDNIIIVEKNQHVYIVGSGHVYLNGDLSVKASGQCNIEVAGNAAVKVGGSAYMQVGGEFNLSAGGNVSISSGGSISLQASGDVAADGAAVWLNSGKSVAAQPVPGYSPSITQEQPITRREDQDVQLENQDDQAAKAKEEAKDLTPITEQAKSEEKPKEPAVVVSECDFVLPLTMDTQLSSNFKIKDLCKDGPFPFGTGQHGLSDVQIACNMKNLCLNVIEPMFKKYASLGIKINSGFRPKGSKVSKSNKISQHELGQAVDFGFAKIRGKRQEFYDTAVEISKSMDFDQLLLESTTAGSIWIHMSCKKEGNRPASDSTKVMTFKDHSSVGSGLRLLA